MNDTLIADLQTLTALWGRWQKALRHVGASEADIRAILILRDAPYYKFTRASKGRVEAAFGFIQRALETPAPAPVPTPACTWSQLAALVKAKKLPLKHLVSLYADETGERISILAITKIRKKGYYTPKTAAFLNWAAKFL